MQISVITLTCCGLIAVGSAAADAMASTFRFQPESSLPLVLDDPEVEIAAVDVRPDFGAQGTVRFQVGGSASSNFNDVSLLQARTSVSWFIVDGVSVDFEADFGAVIQPDTQNGVGGGASFMFRWHMLRKDTWSLYGELGAGMFWSSVDVPEGGGQVKFQPQVGLGVSFEVAEDVRMMLGARWTHLSNARTTSTNPGFDGLGICAMLSFGF